MSWLTDEELEAVIMAAIAEKPQTEAAILEFIRWAEQQRIGHTLLSGVLAGKLKVILRDGEEPAFDLVDREGVR